MIRRFVNLVAKNGMTHECSLHRLDVSKHLFHPSRADARVAPVLLAGGADDTSCGRDDPLEQLLLPAPCVKIHPSFMMDDYAINKLPFWASLSPRRRSEDRFLCINFSGDAMLCSADKPSVDPMPHLRHEVGVRPISVSVARRPDQEEEEEEEEDLYVFIHKSSSFHVLRKDDDDGAGGRWRWESLPPPPFVGDRRFNPLHLMYSSSHAVVDGGRTICLSSGTPDVGTYCFDTVEREWRHAGDWVLPFEGRAEHVPDLALWLGFSAVSPHYHHLCATSDLNTMSSMSSVAMDMEHPPKLEYVWKDIVTPENWAAVRMQVVSLGAGRFCVAKHFVVENRRTAGKLYEYSDHDEEELWEFEEELTVLTGVEVGRDDDESIKVWKHKSMRCHSIMHAVL